MKTLVLSILAMASIAAMTSCSSENDIIDEVNPQGGNEKVEIKVSAGVSTIETKAPIQSGQATTVNILRKDGDGPYAGTPIGVEITDQTDNLFSSSPQYYNIDGTKNTFFFGYYPAIAPQNNIVTFEQDGKEDVLLSNVLDAGNKATPALNPSLTFDHQLSLIKFTFVQGGQYPADDEVTSIKIKGVELPASLDITTRNITWTTDKANSGITAFSNGTYSIAPNNGTSINEVDALMVEPGKKFTLEIVTKNNGTFDVQNIQIGGKTDQVTEKGKQYNITLTFSKKEVKASASIVSWGDVINGSGEVQ